MYRDHHEIIEKLYIYSFYKSLRLTEHLHIIDAFFADSTINILINDNIFFNFF